MEDDFYQWEYSIKQYPLRKTLLGAGTVENNVLLLIL